MFYSCVRPLEIVRLFIEGTRSKQMKNNVTMLGKGSTVCSTVVDEDEGKRKLRNKEILIIETSWFRKPFKRSEGTSGFFF